MQINSTQFAGLVSFIPAAIAAAAAGIATKDQANPATRSWTRIAIVHAVLAAEVVAMSRHRLSGAVGDWLKTQGAYPERRSGQMALILILVLLALLLIRYVVRRASTRRLAYALSATGLLLALFAVETVSLHAIDGILYHGAGPVLLIGWLWLACGWTTAVIATSAVKRHDE